jgi:hypothetical protein
MAEKHSSLLCRANKNVYNNDTKTTTDYSYGGKFGAETFE